MKGENMKNLIKNKKKEIISFILGAILFSGVGAYAAVTFVASDVTYTPSDTTWSVTKVDKALDDLYSTCGTSNSKVYLNKYLRTLVNSSTVLQDDGSGDANMRYIGATPDNYVTFNNESWRIIGVFNSNSHGKNSDLVKIIKTEKIGNIQWNNSNNSDWSTSTLTTYLNTGTYYTGLNSTAKNMIQSVSWKLGGIPTGDSLTLPKIYIIMKEEQQYIQGCQQVGPEK